MMLLDTSHTVVINVIISSEALLSYHECGISQDYLLYPILLETLVAV